MKKYRLFFVLYVCVCLLPLAVFRDYTPSNELRYLSIANEALENGNVFTFTNHGAAYADKPPLYLWIVMGGKLLFGTHVMWFLSLFSLVPALLIVYVMDKWLRLETTNNPLTADFPDNTAPRRTAAWMLVSSGLFLGLAVVLRMDMLMNLFITLSLYEFYKMYTGHATPASKYLFPLYVFLALFSKGPLGFLIPLLCTAVFLATQKQLRTFGRYWGWRTWGVLVLGCVIWFGGAFLEGGTEYLNNLLFHQTVDRAVNAFHHKEPFYYYGITFWYSLAPWSLLVAGVLVIALVKKRFTSILSAFFGTVVATTFVMVSCFSSKLAIYLSPAFPFFVYLAVMQWPVWHTRKWAKILLAVPMGVLACALPAVVVLSAREDTAFIGQAGFYVAAALLSVGALGALYLLFFRKEGTGASVRLTAMALYAALFAGGWSVPRINDRIGYASLCEAALELATQNDCNRYATYFVSRPENMDVYMGVVPEVLSEEEGAATVAPGTVLITREHRLQANPGLLRRTTGRPMVKCGDFVLYAL